jgi:large subunit ribosomal protein L23
MALFKKTETKETKATKPVKAVKKEVAPKEATKEVAVVAPISVGANSVHPAQIIIGPRITEKAGMTAEQGVYVFDVSKRANTTEVAKAIKALYGVAPAKVRMAKVPSKRVIVRGKGGVKSGGKKAYVYMPKGKTIEIV